MGSLSEQRLNSHRSARSSRPSGGPHDQAGDGEVEEGCADDERRNWHGRRRRVWWWCAMRCNARRLLALVTPGVLALVGLSTRAGEPASLEVAVVERPSGRPAPCRLTFTDASGRLVDARPEPGPGIAHRTGVVYTVSGRARVRLARGRIRVQATRGVEYSLAQADLDLGAAPGRLRLELRREVDTSGYLACDPHIHTLTDSGHGDATVLERMATVAGEGIELAIATDHNHHADHRRPAMETGAAEFFTPVVGNEVTTPVGHFNAFPVRPGSPVPGYRSTDWRELLSGVRAVPGVRVVMLNHPSNEHAGYVPTDPRRFHPASGESHESREWAFDGMEVVTSAALQSDLMKPYRDWFALLNHGLRISGMGSSDSHDVNRFILGQGRTYVAGSADRPDRIDVEAACDSILAGKVLVSMGLLTEAWVQGAGPGEVAAIQEDRMTVRVRVQGPKWITADRLDLYLNGSRVLTRPIVHRAGAIVKADVRLSLSKPAQDAWLVAIATGPGVREPFWEIPRPYQPNRADWEPRVIGSTNPIRLDVDGGGWSSPRDTARAALTRAGGDAVRLVGLLAPFDEATAVQAASLLRARGADLNAPALRRAVESAAPAVRHGFVAYGRLLPPAGR